MVFDDPISWLSRGGAGRTRGKVGGREGEGWGAGVNTYRTFISRTRVTVIYMDDGSLIYFTPPPSPYPFHPFTARFVTSISMPITLSEVLCISVDFIMIKRYKSKIYILWKLQFDNKIIDAVSISIISKWQKLHLCISITFTLLHLILPRFMYR